MSRHEAVSCDACLEGNFKGRRYKCLICFDYDLCSTCYENGATTNNHTTNHAMQCILTRHDFDIFHGGEALAPDQPQSLTCPFCGKMGFTEATLQEHVTANHLDTPYEVVCPICASVPGGDPNHLTDDFAAHLTLDHPTGAPRELDMTESGNRHGVRRIQQSRGLNRGAARQNMRFGSVSSGFFPPSARGDSMDPIAELLSQLSGVRRATATTRQQQLERLPNRRTGTAGISGSTISSASSAQTQNANVPNGNNAGNSGLSSGMTTSGGGSGGASQSGVVVNLGSNSTSNMTSAHHPSSLIHSSNKQQQGQSHFLLARLGDMETEQEDPCEIRDRAAFVQELLLSTLSELSLGVAAGTMAITGSTDAAPSTPPVTSTSDATTQTPQSVPSTPTSNNLNSSSTLPTTQTPVGIALTKTPSSTSVTLSTTPLKGQKPPSKVMTRSSPGLQQQQPQQQQPMALQQSNGSNLGSGRVVTGTGTVSVPPPVGGPGRGRATGGSVSPGAGRRKPVRGVEGRTTQPPPPH